MRLTNMVFISEGNARITVFASSANARTFDYQAGDIGKTSDRHDISKLVNHLNNRIRPPFVRTLR